MILRFYGGLFFSYMQAAAFDALLAVAHESAHRDFLLAAIISTASEVVNTVGKHFAQPIRPRNSDGKPKGHLIAKILRDREIDVLSLFSAWLDRYLTLPRATRNHTVIRADYADALAKLDRKVGAVYADPPYTRDHYSRILPRARNDVPLGRPRRLDHPHPRRDGDVQPRNVPSGPAPITFLH